jgi:hypothetical protein
MRLRDEGLAMRQVGGKTMILDLESSTYFAVGGVGTAILEVLQGGECSEEHVVARLKERYEVDEKRLQEDVQAFLQRLDSAGLLVR